MPRGHYGPAVSTSEPQPTIVGADFMGADFMGADLAVHEQPKEGSSAWKTGLMFAAGVTAVVGLGLVMTPFHGKRSRRHPSSPYRSMQ